MSNQLAAAVRFLLAASDPKTEQQYECWKSLKEAIAAHEAAKERTGWPADGRMAQDDSRELSKWLSNTPGARRLVDEAAKPAEHLEKAEHMPGANAFTMAVFDAERVPAGTKLYAAPVAVTEWQPIETAPKDGSLLLLKEKWEDEPFIGQWVSSAYGGKWAASRTHYDTDGNACVIDRVYSDGVAHWMPLPPAPKEQA